MSNNPLMDTTRIPGGRFPLPSRGLFYEDGELSADVNNGEVEVYPMTAYDEILLKTPDLLLDGSAIDRVIKRCVPQVEKPLRLLSRDIDFLLICIRDVSFGSEVRITHNHKCKKSVDGEGNTIIESKDHEYAVSIQDFVQRTKMIDATRLNSEYKFKNDKGYQIFFSPIRYSTMISVLSEDPEDFSKLSTDDAVKFIYEKRTEQLSELICKVAIPSGVQGNIDDIMVTDHKQIHEWVKSLPPKDIRKLNDQVEKASGWGPELIYDVKCKDCEAVMKLEVPLNPMHFFTLR